MKRTLQNYFRGLVVTGLLLLLGFSSQASHIVGGDLSYQWVSGLTYKVTVVLYGNCGTTTGAFETLPISTPRVCIYDGATLLTTLPGTTLPLTLTLDSPGVKVTPICAADSALTQCTNTGFTIPGIKQFSYTATVTLPYYSKTWRFIYSGDNGGGSAAGRASSITSIVSAGSYEIQLIDTLNNYELVNSRQHNSSPKLTVLPTPYYCDHSNDCYNPGAVDLFDTSFLSEPSGDSLTFKLIPATDGNGDCGTPGGPATYIAGSAWTGGPPISASDPLIVTAGTFVFDPNTGQLCFQPDVAQRAIVVYNINEYRKDTTGKILTIAGTGTATYGGDGGPATAGQIDNPGGITTDAAGNIYFADFANNRIRMINSAGMITTIAGNGVPGFCGDGTPSVNAVLNGPMGMTYIPGSPDAIIFADYNNNVVRKISPAAGGIISTVAGTSNNGIGGFKGDGAVASGGAINTIAGNGTPGYAGDGAVLSAATEMDNPAGFTMDAAGNMYFSDYTNNVIRKITTAGVISTIAGNHSGGYCGDSAAATLAYINGPQGLAVNAAGTLLYFADENNNVVRKVDLATGIIYTIAGNGFPAYGGDGASAFSGSIGTLTGTGTAGTAGDLGAASSALVHDPFGMCSDAAGNIYFSDTAANNIRKISPAGVITHVAGSSAGIAGFSIDGTVASGAFLNGPMGLVIDGAGNLYFADNNNSVVRKISTTGILTTVAGTGVAGWSADGPALTTQLNHPTGLAIDPATNALYVSDAGNQIVREIIGGTVTTVAGNRTAGYTGDGTPATLYELNNPMGLSFYGGNLYIADAGNNRVRDLNGGTIITFAGTGTAGYSGDGGAAASAKLNNPTGVYFDAYGFVLIADKGNSRIRRFNRCNTIETIAGNGTAGYAGDGGSPIASTTEINSCTNVFEDAKGNIYVTDHGNFRIRKINPSLLNKPTSVSLNTAGDSLYVADFGNNRVRLIHLPSGNISTVAGTGAASSTGDGGVATSATLNAPFGVYYDNSAHKLYASEYNGNKVRKINVGGTISNFAGTGVGGYGGDDGLAVSANVNNPGGICGDALGNIYIADVNNSLIRKVNTCGYIYTIAGLGISGFCCDGQPAVSAELKQPEFVYVDGKEDVYIPDFGNNRIRKVITPELNHPIGVAYDATGDNLFISDNGNQRIRKISAFSSIISTAPPILSTIAGSGAPGTSADPGLATSAILNSPYGLFWDAATSNLYIADAGNNRIRYINGTTMNTFAGTTAGYAGDGRLKATAQFNSPSDMAIDPLGNMIIDDRGNNCIREINPAGYVYTLAGTTVAGFAGDGGDPILARLNHPNFIWIDGADDIFISDSTNQRIRKIVPNALIQPQLVGTMQREMTFLILDLCTVTTPVGDTIQTFTGPGTISNAGTHYTVCGNNGTIDLNFNPTEAGGTADLTITATGLPAGGSFVVTGNNTPTPHATFSINTATGVTNPGTFTFYVNVQDNNCPLVGSNSAAITITILPVPTISDALVLGATCATAGVMNIDPGGTGKPWTIKVSHAAGDTFQVFTNDTAAFNDTLPPGNDTVTIFTNAGNQCHVGIPLIVPVPSFTITATTTDPTYCGAKDGTFRILGLTPGNIDTNYFTRNGVLEPVVPFIVSPTGTDTVKTLLAGVYTNVFIAEGFCHTDTLSLTLTNPLFTFTTITGKSPTKCGFCDGIDTLFGLHPGQLDTVTYSVGGGPKSQTSTFVTSDGIIVLPGLCSGVYNEIIVNTAGVCSDSLVGPELFNPTIKAQFDTVFHFGCSGDTAFFTNLSVPAADLTYKWVFGDGATSFATSPTHVYNSTIANTLTAALYITNTQCYDSAKATFTLNNFVHADYTLDPPIVCQHDLVTFTNSSTGADPHTNAPPTFTWYFGDKLSSTLINPTHNYANSGQYAITLVAANNIPCYDTAVKYISVDSNSVISLQETDSVLCQGQKITFTGIYSTIGDTLTTWNFGDGDGILNVNPVIHSFDAVGQFTIMLDIKYRACPEKTMSRGIRVYGNPSLYLGPDLAMCPGSNALTIMDQTNSSNPKATWLWNTGETTSSINVVKPGDYSTVVTIDGCTASDTVTVAKDCYMDIPNVFTPNGDGTNDYFYPRQMLTKGVTTFKMNIYNRWGQSVYETTSTDGRGWDGAFNGTPQPEGVYIYEIDATYKDGQIEHHQGNITLLR